MKKHDNTPQKPNKATLEEIATFADYSLLETLNRDPEAKPDGIDYAPRQVFSGHYVPVRPTPIKNPEYVAHSPTLFQELGFADSLAKTDDFIRMFSGDLSAAPAPMRKLGWACGYALSIFGTEFNQQCPFQTGNGYGDGRAISILEVDIHGQRWEMQLKGGGKTPYCRGADGRAVLRSSVREFLAQEHMHALGVPTTRSLSLMVSKTETVQRPWYTKGSTSANPDRVGPEPVAVTTRVAPSFIRVGQIELFARRARNNAHPHALAELEQIVSHLIDREYADVIDQKQDMGEKVVLLAEAFAERLTDLVANWIRVGYCQGNFNSDNCAAGGFTLDYGPFGFCDVFNPNYQPWTGGGDHFSFLNQPVAAAKNFSTFCAALRPLLANHPKKLEQLKAIEVLFPALMQTKMEKMWAAKLGLNTFDSELFQELISLMTTTPLDYTLFFRELSNIPESMTDLNKTFYTGLRFSDHSHSTNPTPTPEETKARWAQWLHNWRVAIGLEDKTRSQTKKEQLRNHIAKQMKQVNPKYSWREWLIVPAYQQAAAGDYTLIHELQTVLTQPYDEQTTAIAEKHYQLKPMSFFNAGGVSHYSCSS